MLIHNDTICSREGVSDLSANDFRCTRDTVLLNFVAAEFRRC